MVKERLSDCWYDKVCIQKSENCETNCIRYNEMVFLIENSGIPKAKQGPIILDGGEDYEIFEQLAYLKDNIVEFVEDGENIYLASERTGNGKTSWSIKFLLKYFDQIWAGNGFRVRGLFIHVPTLLMKLKNFDNPMSETYKKNILECDLVVWDDIATTQISNYDYNNLLNFIDYRLSEEKSNIFTGNQTTKDNLENILGVRLASRVWNPSKVYIFKGKDRR